MRAGVLDPLVFSSVWVAGAAAALCLASGSAMGAWPSASVLGLAFCGTLVVYNVDRLRDLPRDRTTSPARSDFVDRHHRALVGLCVGAAVASGLLVVESGPSAAALLLPVLLAGLLHRRLKRFGWWKPFYVSASWTVVAVGLPAVTMHSPRHIAWVAAVVGTTVAANVIASNLRDGEALSLRFGARVPLRIARTAAVASAAIGAMAPAPMRPLTLVPLATLAALLPFRSDERYGHVIVDGALLLGALLALPWLPA